jgi:glutathione S-transferase
MLRLVIGNKNYSSWSLRAWLLMRQLDIEFEERLLPLGTPQFEFEIERLSPSRRVPVLQDGPVVVWDSLAIAEYLAERFPERAIWPRGTGQRARARSMCAEMHAGFAALRTQCPMNIQASLAGRGWNLEVQRDLDRLARMWSGALDESGGPFLFGSFGAVDAFFAPVVSRLKTYELPMPARLADYRQAVLNSSGMRAWSEAARLETAYLAADEPYRPSLLT